MFSDIETAYVEEQTLLIEAGTGIGKSIAYLLPALLWAEKTSECTVISTHTIALQEQLLEKELPLLLDALNLDLKIVLLKGMGNYTCLKKESENATFVMADRESCTHVKCPFFKKCTYFRQKREAEKADLIIVNHHLLFADMASDHAVIPEYDRLIIDEAHHIEDVATQYFADKISRINLIKLAGKNSEFIQAIETLFQDVGSPRRLHEITWEGAAKRVLQLGSSALDSIEDEMMEQSLKRMLDTLESYITSAMDDGTVRWVEPGILVRAKLEVASYLKEALFERVSTVILCSATLTTAGSFTYMKSRLGIELSKERIYESPFDYESQALLVVPTDIPDPNHPNFILAATRVIWDAIEHNGGGTFVLFTSYAMLHACKAELEQQLLDANFPLLVQGEQKRTELLNTFRAASNSVLFGTDSFWEGVDVVGDELRCVILVRLPFKAPGDPLFEARSEKIQSDGGSPFFDYALPQAIVKFKQGFGRLIRNREDRGSVICLDSRLIKKGYGKLFLQSLPPCTKEAIPMSHLPQLLEHFAL